jgi:hypothetical protein
MRMCQTLCINKIKKKLWGIDVECDSDDDVVNIHFGFYELTFKIVDKWMLANEVHVPTILSFHYLFLPHMFLVG